VKSASPSQATIQEHQETRRKYVQLAWELWASQQRQGFFVWHPIPEEHLRIEVTLFWQGQISHLAGWNDIVGQLVNAVVSPIKGAIEWFWENVIRPGIEFIISGVKWVVDGILAVVNTIGSAVAALPEIFKGALGWLWEQFQGFFSAIGEVLKQIGTWVLNAIKTYVVDPILGLLQPIFEGLKAIIMALWNFMTGGAITGSPIEWRGSLVRWLGILSGVSVMAVSGLIGAELINLVHPFKDTKAGEIAKFAMQFSGIAFLQAAFFTTYFDIACAKPIRHELNAIFAPEIPSIGEAQRMLWRGQISPGDFDDVVKLSGYGEPWIGGYRALTENVPGSGDLILFLVREVLTPDEFYVAMGYQGFSNYWSRAYWEAHWVLPPPERTRTAFLRKQIPEAEYRKFLIWYDFKPDPRPGISLSDVDIMLSSQYEWPGRIDTRWLIEWGIITPEEGVELIKAGGMDPAWAPRVAEAYLLNQVREELGKVRAVYERRLREGFMSKADFAKALYSLHFATHVVNALERWADEELDLEERLDEVKEFEALAKDEVINVTEYGAALRELGMTEDRITRAQKHIERLLAIKAAKAAAKAKG